MSESWTNAGSSAGLLSNGRCLLRVAGFEVAVFKIGDALHAIEDSCPHGGASLCMGKLDGQHIQCRAHGLRFRVTDGRPAGCPADAPPSRMDAKTFPVRIVGDSIELQLPTPAAAGA